MAHFHVKKKNGRPYLYVREIARVRGRPKVVHQIYIGSPERVSALASGALTEETRLRVEEFGALWAANLMDQDVDLAGIVDSVVRPDPRDQGPSVGEYFLYCVLNRMVESRSKNRLAEWYRRSAIQQIRPVDIEALTSQRYWEKWDRVSEADLEMIGKRFFEKIWELESPEADCFLFDTTNYYTFMASDTESDLALRGNNKAGRHHLRQMGLGLLVGRESRLPLYYRVYPGNMHDSKLFHGLMDEMFAVACGLHRTKRRMTVVIDKGMNAEGNYAFIDEHAQIHFVTTYSTYFAQDLAITPMEKFEPIDIDRNRRLLEEGKPQDLVLAYRTRGEYWGRDRAVVVTHNPVTARKQDYTLESKIEVLRQELLEMRAKVRQGLAHWRNPEAIEERYFRLCERLHVSSDLFTLELSKEGRRLTMSFRKDPYRLERHRAAFGRNIIITDNVDWTTAQIVQTSLERWQVEGRFRQGNDDELVSGRPIRHWTDSKIRCHLFTCVAAMTYLRRLERRLEKAGKKLTAASVMEEMKHWHSVLTLENGRRRPQRRLEAPTKTQAEVLSGLGYHVDARGVLQPPAG